MATVPISALGFQLDGATFGFIESMASNDEAFQGDMHALISAIRGNGWVNRKL